MTPLLKRLEASGLVTRTSSAQDERQVVVAPSPAGRALEREAGAIQDGVLGAAACEPAELAAIKRQLDMLRGKLAEHG